MKKLLAVSVVALSMVIGGCNESQTVTQLKLEKAQIVKEFGETKAKMQQQIDQQTEKITTLEAKVKEQQNTIDGYNKLLFELIPENEKMKKENEELKKKLSQDSQTTPAVTGEEAQKKLEQLKALQEKAKNQ